MKQGIIVLGHGSHASIGEPNQVIFQITDIIKSRIGHDLIETAILYPQSGLQSIDEAVKILADKGAERIIIAPMFFINGAHVSNSIPEKIAKLRVNYPQINIAMAAHIGADPRIAEILLDRIMAVNNANKIDGGL